MSPALARRQILAALVLATTAAVAFGEAELASVDDIRASTERLVAEALAEPLSVGLSVAVAVGDEIILEQGFGKAELEHDADVDAASVFRIGSITKQFTAALVMRLIEEGVEKDGTKLTLDAPISAFLDFPTQGRTVTVRQLLTHTSGIKSYTGLGEAWQKTIPLELSHEELLDLVDDLEFDFEPDASYRYNNTGYYLLGVLVEEVTGQTYAEALEERLIAPLGLESIRYGSNRDIIPGRAQGYSVNDGELANDGLIGMSQPGAAGALLATAGDLVRWQRALVSGRVVSPESYRGMTTPHVLADGESTGYGFGLALDELEDVPRVQHGGGINGFNSMLAYFPDQELSVAVISNSEGYSAARLAEAISRAALGIELTALDEPVSEAEGSRVTGTYTLTGTPLEFEVSSRDGKVYARATGQQETRLRLQGPGEAPGSTEYRPDFDDNIRIVFAAGSPSPELTLYQGGATIPGPRKAEGDPTNGERQGGGQEDGEQEDGEQEDRREP